MEQETFLSGYCRSLDGNRTVCVVTENGALTDVDCSYPDCPHRPDCVVADKIGEFLEKA